MSDSKKDPNIQYETGAIQSGFEFPGWIWTAMFGCYAVFFLFITLATGRDRHALFAIVISALVHGNVSSAPLLCLHRLRAKNARHPCRAGKYLQTYTGPMSLSAVVGQVLAIPIALAIFAIAIAIVLWIRR